MTASDIVGLLLHGIWMFRNRWVSTRGLLARFLHLHGPDLRTFRLLSYIFLSILGRALGRPHDLALRISGFSFPACLQASGEFEAWENVCFRIDDDGIEG